MEKHATAPQERGFLSMRQLAEKYPFRSEEGWRWTRFNGDLNGFSACVTTVGGRVIIDEARFLDWMRAQVSEPNIDQRKDVPDIGDDLLSDPEAHEKAIEESEVVSKGMTLKVNALGISLKLRIFFLKIEIGPS